MDSYNYLNLSNGRNFLYVIGVILVFLILLREVRNWYWKHNDMISLMGEISEKLTILNDSINKQNKNDSQIEVSPPEDTHINEEVIKEDVIEKKPKESIWTRKLF